MKSLISSTFCGLALLTAVPVSGATLAAVADSYVDKGSASANFGTSAVLRVKNANSNFVRKAYMRFDVSSLTFDHTVDLQSASLLLEFPDTGAGLGGGSNNWTFQVYGLNDGDAGENWGESTINWNNAPQNDTANGNGVLGGATSLGTFSFVGRTQSVNFTGTGGTAVRDFVAASTSDDLLTFIVVRDTPESGGDTYIHGIASKENGSFTAPTLDLTAVPEPSTAVLLGSFALAGLMRRRR